MISKNDLAHSVKVIKFYMDFISKKDITEIEWEALKCLVANLERDLKGGKKWTP